MPVTEVTSYINSTNDTNPFPFTLQKSNETGYFLLKPFLPLLKQLNEDNTEIDMNELQNDIESIDNNINTESQDLLLSKFGILVDTDNAGEKWITEDKAYLILSMLNLLHLFEDQFEKNNSDSELKLDNEDKLAQEVDNEKETTPDDKDQLDISNDETSDANQHIKDEELPQTQTIDESQTSNKENTDTSENKDNNKRSNNMEDLGLNLDSHKELGSPLKKMKFEVTSRNQEENKENTNLAQSEESPIAIFSHDLTDEFINVPLELHKTIPSNSVPDNDERMKLEAFLQRLLFPEVPNGSEDGIGASQNTSPSFELLLNEINQSFPGIELNLNIPVDEHGNTPLHWLTSIANLDLVKQLVKSGSNRFIGDNMGESALVKAVKSVNNYDSGTFEELLDYLYPCLVLEDSMNRSILHHIVITSGMTGCSSAAKYYLDILMGWIVKESSRPAAEGNEKDEILKNLDLKWVISYMLNAQDSNGDTCLNIAARLGNVSMVDSLLDYGADPSIPNKSGLRPVDFGAGTSKLHSQSKLDDSENKDFELKDEAMTNEHGVKATKKPDTAGLMDDIKSLLNAVSKDYEIEVSQHNEKLEKLHKDLTMQREKLTESREQLAKSKELRDQYNLLKEQLKNIQDGIQVEEEIFRDESKKLGISAEEASGIDWDSSEFDADEPFRVDFIYDLLENKLMEKYNGDVEKMLGETDVDSVVNQLKEKFKTDSEAYKLQEMLPPAVLLKARISAYKRNDEYLENTLSTIRYKQDKLESKFRRVLSLCLKIDEEKVDDMLDGLLQAISSEDPQDIDTDEMQDFLKKHAV